jgi:hypothetical protein
VERISVPVSSKVHPDAPLDALPVLPEVPIPVLLPTDVPLRLRPSGAKSDASVDDRQVPSALAIPALLALVPDLGPDEGAGISAVHVPEVQDGLLRPRSVAADEV